MRLRVLLLSVFTAVLAWSTHAEARDKNSCQQAWSQAVRSYLTTNRKAAPDGTVPKDLDAKELADQAWLASFSAACDLEANGDKAGARVEAAMIGVQVLARLDARGCERFMQYYMDSTQGRDVCSVGTTASTAELRKKIATAIPSR
ncbi:MAG: hypothetical protein RIT81_41430 [Deltaproteobacteria bacterium]